MNAFKRKCVNCGRRFVTSFAWWRCVQCETQRTNAEPPLVRPILIAVPRFSGKNPALQRGV